MPIASKLMRALPKAILAKGFRETAASFVATKAGEVTIVRIQEAYAHGRTIQEGIGMADPDVRAFLVNAAQQCPWLLDEITFEVFMGWVNQGNPTLAAQVLGDPALVVWGARGWVEGVQELKRVAGLSA